MSASIWSPDGTIPSEAPPDYVYKRIWIDIAAGQTLVNFASVDPTFVYTPGLQSLEVGIDGGMPLQPGVDYTETSASSITLVSTPTDSGRLYAAVGRPINVSPSGINASLVPYTFPDGVVRSVQDLAMSIGTTGIGHLSSITGAGFRALDLKLEDIVSVRDISGFTGNDSADDTDAIQQCADNGGAYLLPSDITAIRLTSTINITKPITFYGAGCNPFTSIDETSKNIRGSGPWFHIDHAGKGFNITPSTDSMAVIRFEGCGTFRNQPTPGAGAFTPTVNDWDMEANNCEVQLEDFVFLNPTKAFNAADLSRGGRLRLNNVRGQPLTYGIQIDKCYDLAHLDVHWWPYWSLNTNVKNWTYANLRGLVTARVDGLRLLRYFTIFHGIGWLVDDYGSGSVNRAHADWAYLDVGSTALTISDSVGGGGRPGATINAAELTAYGLPGSTSYGISVSGTGSKLTIGFFDAEAFYDQLLYLGGTSNRVQASISKFKNYGLASGATPGIVVDATNTLILDGEPENIPNSTQPLLSNAGTVRIGQTRSGTVTLPAASTSVAVTGLNFVASPRSDQINLGFVTFGITAKLRPSGISPTGFVINADVAPGADITLCWQATLTG